MELIFVTGNPKKFSEVQKNIDSKVTLTQVDLDIEEIQDNSLEKVSADKAIKAFEILQKPLIVEDAGIFFDDYENFPGVFSKYMFQSLGFDGFEKLLIDSPKKIGKMVAVTSYIEPGMVGVKQFIGEIKGVFNFDNLSNLSKSMPYNSIFIPDGYDKKVSEMYDERMKINHRVCAISKLNEFLNTKN